MQKVSADEPLRTDFAEHVGPSLRDREDDKSCTEHDHAESHFRRRGKRITRAVPTRPHFGKQRAKQHDEERIDALKIRRRDLPAEKRALSKLVSEQIHGPARLLEAHPEKNYEYAHDHDRHEATPFFARTRAALPRKETG